MDKFYVNNKDVVCPELYHLATVQHKEKYEQLKADNKRLKEALEEISLMGNTRACKKAEQALKGEVKNGKEKD